MASSCSSKLGPPASGKDPQKGDAKVAVDDLDGVVKDLVGLLGDRRAALGDDDDLVVVVVVLGRGWGRCWRRRDAGRGAVEIFFLRESKTTRFGRE